MKSISLVQVNFQQGPTECNAFYLPYSVGCIWSYANQFADIQDNYRLEHIIWRRNDINETAALLSTQDIVVFSCYIWNRKYSYHLAQLIKKLNPNCTTIFGGPQPAITKKDIFKNNPEIDIVVKGEGEITFKNLLSNWNNPESVPGLLLNHNTEVVDTGEAPRIQDLTELPSPYLTGFFDKLVADNPDVEWNATLETNRGCPYQCTFCDWGSLTYSKIKKFSLEKVFAELTWMSQNKCGVVAVADSNFGMFPDRDHQIVDHFINLQIDNGFPYMWQAAWAKNQKKEVIDIIARLTQSTKSFNQGLTLSLQTLDDNVLTIIRRKNMHENNIAQVFQQAEQKSIPVFTEMILGLPGESLESWKENFYKMSRMGLHSNIDVTSSQLLENAEMNLVQRKIYDIKTIEVFDFIGAGYNNDEYRESIAATCSTIDMPKEDMAQALTFVWYFVTFHNQGYSNWISRYLFKHCNVDYRDFYEGLWEHIQKHPWFKQRVEQIQKSFTSWLDTGFTYHPEVGGVNINSWNIYYVTSMEIQLYQLFDMVFDMLNDYIVQYNIDPDIQRNLMQLQRSYITNLLRLDQFPNTQTFDYNIYDNLVSHAELVKAPVKYRFDFPFTHETETSTYLERLFYSRRSNYGRAKITHEN